LEDEIDEEGNVVRLAAINMSSNDLMNSHISNDRTSYVSESLMAKRGRYATEARMKANRSGMFGRAHKNTVIIK
jgi:hypothetical protein